MRRMRVCEQGLLGAEVEHDGEGDGEEDADVDQEARGNKQLFKLCDLAYGSLLGTCGVKMVKRG